MASTAWQTLNGPVRIAEVHPTVPPVLEADSPLGDAPATVVEAEPGGFDWPQAHLGVEDRTRRVLRQDLEGTSPVPPVLDLLLTPEAETPQPPPPSDGVTAGIPIEAVALSLLWIHEESLAPIEFAPVLRRLTVWSPLPSGNHSCVLRREDAEASALPLLNQALVYDPSPVDPEDGRDVESLDIPDPIHAGVPGTVPVKTITQRRGLPRKEPEIRILGNVIRFEFPTLN